MPPELCALTLGIPGAQQTPEHILTLLGRRRDGLQDQLQLVECRCAWEQGSPPKHLPQDAAQTPHVHPRGVPGAGRGGGLGGGTPEVDVEGGGETLKGAGPGVLGGGR